MNDAHNVYFPRFDRWFELHDRGIIELEWRNKQQINWLRECGKPVYMQRHHEDIPNSVEYPKDQMISEFGRYFTSTASFMLALAIHEGFREIDIFGIDSPTGTGYEDQRLGIEYFIGIARGRDIEVYIPRESQLLKASRLYGYSSSSLEEEIQLRVDELTIQERKLMVDLNFVEGMIRMCQDPEVDGVQSAAPEWQEHQDRLGAELQKVRGRLQECRHWLNHTIGSGETTELEGSRKVP